jgi:PIN domain nuclease of toxin-antitoxin system
MHYVLKNSLQKQDKQLTGQIRKGNNFLRYITLEIAMLLKKERVKIDTDYKTFIKLVLNSNKYTIWGITPEIAELSVCLPSLINKDPADRIIAATSIICHAPLVTADENLNMANELTTIW